MMPHHDSHQQTNGNGAQNKIKFYNIIIVICIVLCFMSGSITLVRESIVNIHQ